MRVFDTVSGRWQAAGGGIASAAALVVACSGSGSMAGPPPHGGGVDGGAADGSDTLLVDPPTMIFSDPQITGQFVLNDQGLYLLACPAGTGQQSGTNTCGPEVIRVPKDGSGGSTVVVPGWDYRQGQPQDPIFVGAVGANATGFYWVSWSEQGTTASVNGPMGLKFGVGRPRGWLLDRTQEVSVSFTQGIINVDQGSLSMTLYRPSASPPLPVVMFNAKEPGCMGDPHTVASEGGVGYYLSACANVPAGKTTYNLFVLKTPAANGVLPTPVSTWVDDSGTSALSYRQLVVRDGAVVVAMNGATSSKLLLIAPAGGAPKVITTFAGLLFVGASDAANAYVTEAERADETTGAVYRVPLDGSAKVAIATDRKYLSNLLADDSYLYWAEGLSALNSGPGTGIWRAGKGSGTPAQ
jgi:hypothetical protein